MASGGFALAASALFVGTGTGEQSLREAAQASELIIGTAVRPLLRSETAYTLTLARGFNMLEPEDALKSEVARPARQSFDFSQADLVVDFATRHNVKVRGHTLVWHRQNPKWLMDGNYASPER
jgi:endo-1,4-beta-xylanase